MAKELRFAIINGTRYGISHSILWMGVKII